MSKEGLAIYLNPDFENAWQVFWSNDADMLPQGKAGIRAEDIQQQVNKWITWTNPKIRYENWVEKTLGTILQQAWGSGKNYKVTDGHNALGDAVQQNSHGVMKKQHGG